MAEVDFEEENRFFGQRHARFGGVVGVVEADADDLADIRDAGRDARRVRDERQGLGADGADAGERVVAEGGAVDVC